MSFDAAVIVAGAGPAGATAARALASKRIDTLVVDRATFPRNKPCGGGITVRALGRFPWLGAALASVDVHRIGNLHFEGPDGSALDLESADPCVLLVRRIEFDQALVGAATAAGARFDARFEVAQVDADKRGVTLQSRDGRRLRAPLVVAADGVHSVIAKRLGVNRHWPPASLAIDMMEETPVRTLSAARPDLLWVAYTPHGLDGYAYVFPKTNHVNVGIGCLLSHYKEAPERPYVLQEEFVRSLVDGGVLRGRSDRRHFTPFLIPVGGPLGCPYRGRTLFVGDAGGFVHAVTAEGIYYAMVSGECAALAIASMGSAGPPEDVGRRYDRLWRREIGAELADAVLIQRYLFARHERVSRAVRGGARRPWMSAMVAAYARGDVTYASLRRRMLVRLPSLALHLAIRRMSKWGNGAMGQ
jgi:geranylgeranyl reductase family protein